MASHLFITDKILEIHTEDLSIVIKSTKPPLFENVAETSLISAVDITAASLKRIKLASCKIDRKYTRNSPEQIHLAIPPLFFENTDYEIIVQSTDLKPVVFWHENPVIRESIAPVSDGDGHLISGVANFGNSIGLSEIKIIRDGIEAAVLNIEIFPTRIGYKEDFALIKSDILFEMHSAAVNFLQKKYGCLNANSKTASPTEKLINIISAGIPDIFKTHNFIFQSDRQLMRHMELQSEANIILSMSDSNIAQLYEYWCFIRLAKIINNLNCRMISKDVLCTSESSTTALLKTVESALEFINPRTDEKISLKYLPSLNEKAHITLTVENRGGSGRQYIFAPRYSIEAAADGNIGPHPDDIDVMHRYRNTPSSDAGAETHGAYVLFPHSDEETYSEHPFCKSIEAVNVGGLPFMPDASKLAETLVKEIISKSEPKSITLPAGYESVLANLNFDECDVLVGSFGSIEQFEDNLENLYYYIPERNFELERLPIHTIALYQSAKLFGEEAAIRYLGDVTDCRRVKRKQIKFPMRRNNPDEWYFVFSVRAWRALPSPIKIRDEGVFKPKYTNMFLLNTADYSYELFDIHSREKFRLMYELKYILNSAPDSKNQTSAYRLNSGGTVYIRDGYFDVQRKNGEKLFEPPLRISEISRRLKYYFNLIENKLRQS